MCRTEQTIRRTAKNNPKYCYGVICCDLFQTYVEFEKTLTHLIEKFLRMYNYSLID